MKEKKNLKPITPERILSFSLGFAPPLIIEAAVKYQIFDALDDAPKTAKEICINKGVSERALTILMNALVGLDLLRKDDEEHYKLTDESSLFLVSSKQNFQGGLFRNCSNHIIPKWLNLNKVIKDGKPSVVINQENKGAKFFQQFVEDIFSMSYPATKVLANVLAIPQVKETVSVLDLAAGSGVWGIGLAQKSKKVKVTAIDWPDVIEVTVKMAARFGLKERFTMIEGDIMKVNFGSGHHIAILGHILHSEGEKRSQALIKKTFEALAPNGTIVIAEWLVDEKRMGPPHSLIFAVNMLVSSENGNTFSFSEIKQWLEAAGFSETRTVNAPGPSPLILATKPNE